MKTDTATELKEFKTAAVQLLKQYITEQKSKHTLPIQNQSAPCSKAFFDSHLSVHGEGILKTADIFNANVAPSLIRSNHPRFFNWVVGGHTPASVLGDFYTTLHDQIVMLCGYGVATQLEQQTINWLLELFDLSTQDFCGVFTNGATEANLCALISARQWYGRQNNINISQEGLYRIRPPAVLTGLVHSSIDKSLQILGFGKNALAKISTLNGKMCLQDLEAKLQKNLNAIVVANCGEVNSGQIDHLKEIAILCKKYNAWFHVDAAFGLFARCVPELKSMTNGIEYADSITCDGHKLGNVPYSCGFFFLNKKNYQYLTQSFSTVAPYLSNHHDHPMNTRIANSQRLLSLPFWFSLLSYGKNGYRDMVRRQCLFAKELESLLNQNSHYEVLMPVEFNILLFKNKKVASIEENNILIQKICKSNQLSLSGTVFNNQPAIRIAVAHWDIDIKQDLSIVFNALTEGSIEFLAEKE